VITIPQRYRQTDGRLAVAAYSIGTTTPQAMAEPAVQHDIKK